MNVLLGLIKGRNNPMVVGARIEFNLRRHSADLKGLEE